MKIKVAIVEDNEDIRNGLMMMINYSSELVCNQTYGSAEEALKGIPVLSADVVLMDIDLPCMNGIECIKKLKEICTKTQFMMLTVFEDEDKIFRSLKAGASGYMLKKTSSKLLVEAIKEVFNGGSPMNAQIARKVVTSFQQVEQKMNQQNIEGLSKRELELLELLSKGFRYKEIAEKLFISVDTVRTHIRNIYVKLHVNSKTEAINKAFDK